MTNVKPYPQYRPAALLAIVLLLAALPAVQAQDNEPATVNAVLTFRDSSVSSVTLDDKPFPIDTIAGRVMIHPRDIPASTVFTPGGKAILAMRNGERWAVDADALATALFGRKTAWSRGTGNQALRSISITAPNPYQASLSHGYKVLFKDNSIAIIDPSTVSLPVKLESGKDEIPLGSVNALKFAIPDGRKIPDSVFVRLHSGHIYKLPWAGTTHDFSCESMTGNTLTIAYTDILGLLPSASDISSNTGNAPNSQIRLLHLDQTTTTAPAPLQMWSFKTSFGRLSLPSTVVSSFTIPRRWRGQGKVYTIYGDCFEGRPDFRSLIHDHDGQARTLALKSLQQVDQVPHPAQLPLPSAAFVFYLVGGDTLAGIPYAHGTLIESQEGKAILPHTNSSITRTKSDLWVYAPPHGAPVLCRPMSTRIEIGLITSGQRVRLDWKQIEKIEFNRPIRTRGADHESGTHTLPLEAALPAKAFDDPAETASPPPDTQTDDNLDETPSVSWFGWFRGRRSGDSTDEAPTASIALPEYVRQTGDTVRIRLIRGDIITGTVADDRIPFAPTDKNDPRDHVAVDALRRIISTGHDTLQYETAQGSQTGKASRDRIAFKPVDSPSAISIAIRDIEAVIVGSGPLPPPVTHSAGRPPALSGLVYLPGGSFIQGSGETGMTDETPKINVTLSPFFLDATEVTHAQFTAFVRDSGYKTTAERTGSTTTWMNPGFLQQPDDPVVCVSWTDAAEFCNWRSRQSSLQPVYKINRDGSIATDRTANGYRLPTESEWEFAAGGMRSTAYPWGNTFATPSTSAPLANFMQRDGEKDDGWHWTNPVNAFPPDPNGIYGMAGNVWEWCEDWYFNRAYDALKNRSPLNPCIQQADAPGLTHRVMRGGSYRNPADLLRTASRGSGLPHAYAPHVGFRCARNVN